MNTIQNRNLTTLEVKKKDFIAYFIEYLKRSTYIKAKNIATDYLIDFCNYEYNIHNINGLARRFTKIINVAQNLSLIVKYNNNKVYKVIKPINYTTLEHKLIRKTELKNFTIGATSDV